MQDSRQLNRSGLAIAAAASLALAFGLTACQNVATYTQPTVVRVIDASYMAPALNVNIEGTLFASNLGQGTFTPYGTLPPAPGALITITDITSGAKLISANASLLAGRQNSIFLTDNGVTPATYTVTVLADQQIAAANGHSAFRFLNQALKTGPVDIYMVPNGVALADAIPIVTNLPVGAVSGYISFQSQTVTMVVTPTGVVTPKYTSPAIALVGGEVRTALIVNAQLTTDPPVTVFIGSDVN